MMEGEQHLRVTCVNIHNVQEREEKEEDVDRGGITEVRSRHTCRHHHIVPSLRLFLPRNVVVLDILTTYYY